MIWLHKIWTDLRKVEEDQNKVLKELLGLFQSVTDILGMILLFELMLKVFIIFVLWILKEDTTKMSHIKCTWNAITGQDLAGRDVGLMGAHLLNIFIHYST